MREHFKIKNKVLEDIKEDEGGGKARGKGPGEEGWAMS